MIDSDKWDLMDCRPDFGKKSMPANTTPTTGEAEAIWRALNSVSHDFDGGIDQETIVEFKRVLELCGFCVGKAEAWRAGWRAAQEAAALVAAAYIVEGFGIKRERLGGEYLAGRDDAAADIRAMDPPAVERAGEESGNG